MDLHATPGGTAHPLEVSPHADPVINVPWLARQQTILQERHVEGEQINTDPPTFYARQSRVHEKPDI